MTVQVKAQIQGHPWDLWGLAKLFDGNNPEGIHVEGAVEPSGAPEVPWGKPDDLKRYLQVGHLRVAQLLAKGLAYQSIGQVDLNEAAESAASLVKKINGIAKLLDPEFYGVRLVGVAYSAPGGGGGKSLGELTPNKGYTHLGRVQEHWGAAEAWSELAATDPATRFVLEAFNLPISWASLYLVYDCIAGTVGGTKALENAGFVAKAELKKFTKTANNVRDFRVGARHGSEPDTAPQSADCPLHEGHRIVQLLAHKWLAWRYGQLIVLPT